MDFGTAVTVAAITDHVIRSSVTTLLLITIIVGVAILIYVYREKLFRKS